MCSSDLAEGADDVREVLAQLAGLGDQLPEFVEEGVHRGVWERGRAGNGRGPGLCRAANLRCGRGGIRTRVTRLYPVNRFSKPAPSATRPPVRGGGTGVYQAAPDAANDAFVGAS